MQANKMTSLLNKIERRLGTAQLNLPENLQKDKWAEEVIANETLDTFSRYIPNAMEIRLDKSCRTKDGYYLIDELIGDNIEIIGVRDIDWSKFNQQSLRLSDAYGYGYYNFLTNNYGMDDIALLQGRADQMSLFNNNIFVDFVPPNKVKFTTVTGSDITRTMDGITITVFVKHATNLKTIPPTMMETFEKLAEADIARFLYENLKYFDGLETVYANVDLKLSDLEAKASVRDDIIEKLEEARVSAANKYQPLMLTV
jgi:hypothetical protein